LTAQARNVPDYEVLVEMLNEVKGNAPEGGPLVRAKSGD
jgi:hypothetical protein